MCDGEEQFLKYSDALKTGEVTKVRLLDWL